MEATGLARSLRQSAAPDPGAGGRSGRTRQVSPSELRVRSGSVVLGLPAAQGDAGLRQRGEQRLVQQLIPQAAVEAFDEGILYRLARRDVVLFDTGRRPKRRPRVPSKFR